MARHIDGPGVRHRPAGVLGIAAPRARAEPQNPMDPCPTELGYIPLPDLGLGTYTRDGHTELGGLYPGGWPIRPPEFEATVLNIAPRGNQPAHAALATLADPLFGIDHEVASTSRFDGRIRFLVRIVKEFDKPVIVRIGGEFNGRWNGYHPYEYPKAFRKMVETFRAEQVENAAFVWCYEPVAPGNFDERNAAGEYKWFRLISYDWSRSSCFAQTGWRNNDFPASPLLVQKLVEELRKPQYLHARDQTLLKDYR